MPPPPPPPASCPGEEYPEEASMALGLPTRLNQHRSHCSRQPSSSSSSSSSPPPPAPQTPVAAQQRLSRRHGRSENIGANSTFSKSYEVTPTLAKNREKRGLALDGKLKHEDTNLASTTILRPGMDKEVLGILVSYKVKVNLMVSRGGIMGDLTSSDIGVEMPVILMHPKPSDNIASAEDIVIEEFAQQKLKGEKDDEEEKEEEEK